MHVKEGGAAATTRMRPLAVGGRPCGLSADAGPAWCRQTWTPRGCRSDWTDGLPSALERAAGGAGLRGDTEAVESAQEADVAAVVEGRLGSTSGQQAA